MTTTFPDRNDQLFGREAHVQYLCDRAGKPGLTAVVARPLMGKTWTLTEVARRLSTSGQYLVGYHESTAAESSHLLYTVSNLYARWLADSNMREQALSLWQRHIHDLVPRIGQMVGSLFKKLASQQFPEGVGPVISAAFDGLASAQKDLLSGGLHIAPLPYDQALSLTKLVAQVSGRRVVLILDAWEKSPSMCAESAALEIFLKHRDDWPHTHVFLAIRNPDVDSTQANADAEAYQRAHDLCKINLAARVYDLPPINLTDSNERARIVAFVYEHVPVAQQVGEQDLLEMIDNYPGVLYFWRDPAKHTEMQTADDLRQEAGHAQAGRYPEFDHLLKDLEENPRTLAVRLAFFPRLDAERWKTFQPWLMKDLSEAAIHGLIDAGVLSDDRFPTYGHDTRHAAARRWFITHKQPLIRRTAEDLIKALAAGIKGTNIHNDYLLIAALTASSEVAQHVNVEPITRCLIDAARLAFDKVEGISHSTFDHSTFDEVYPTALQSNRSFVPLLAMALISRGITSGQHGDSDGAITDYTATITLPGAPPIYVAQALYNRGVTLGLRGDSDGAIADYTAAIELPGAPPEWVARAFNNRGATKDQRDDNDGAIADFTAIIELPGAPPEEVAKALYNCGVTRGLRGDSDGEIADYTAAIELPGAPPEYVAKALYNRGVTLGQRGDSDGEIADYTAAIELPGAPPEEVAKALYNRGVTRGQRGDSDGAIADYTAAIELPGALPEQVAKALCSRGNTKGRHDDSDGAIADYTAAIELPGALPEQVAEALYNRGVTRGQRGDSDGAITDYTAAIELPGAPPEWVARAFNNCGIIRGLRGDNDGAIADYTAAIELPGAPPEQVAKALYNRAITREERDDSAGAIDDYTAAIKLPGAPPEYVAKALYNRGVTRGQCGDSDGMIADYTAAIELPGALPEQVAKALYNRAITRRERDNSTGAIDDYTAAIKLPGAPPEYVAMALTNRGNIKGQRGDSNGAIDDYTATIKLPGAPPEYVAMALTNRGNTKGQRGDNEGAIADYTAVLTLPGATAEVIAFARKQLTDRRPSPQSD